MKRSDFIKRTATGMTALAFSTIDLHAINSKSNQEYYDYSFSGTTDDGITINVTLEGELKAQRSFMDLECKSKNDYLSIRYTILQDFKANKKIKVRYYEAYESKDDSLKTIRLAYDNPLRQIDRIKVTDKSKEEILNLYKKGKTLLEFRNKKEGCYLTTACTENRGLPDDCYELETLRGFRDNILRKNKNGREIIDEYYATAPAIVSIIHSIPEKNKYLNFIYEKLVLKTIELVEKKEFE